MNVGQLKDEIKLARNRMSTDLEFIKKTEQELAEYACPFKVGDRVKDRQGNEEQIASISYSSWSNGYSFKTFKIKKNGEPYQNSSYCYGQDKYTKVEDK